MSLTDDLMQRYRDAVNRKDRQLSNDLRKALLEVAKEVNDSGAEPAEEQMTAIMSRVTTTKRFGKVIKEIAARPDDESGEGAKGPFKRRKK